MEDGNGTLDCANELALALSGVRTKITADWVEGSTLSSSHGTLYWAIVSMRLYVEGSGMCGTDDHSKNKNTNTNTNKRNQLC